MDCDAFLAQDSEPYQIPEIVWEDGKAEWIQFDNVEP